jgi:hypothetical protein
MIDEKYVTLHPRLLRVQRNVEYVQWHIDFAERHFNGSSPHWLYKNADMVAKHLESAWSVLCNGLRKALNATGDAIPWRTTGSAFYEEIIGLSEIATESRPAILSTELAAALRVISKAPRMLFEPEPAPEEVEQMMASALVVREALQACLDAFYERATVVPPCAAARARRLVALGWAEAVCRELAKLEIDMRVFGSVLHEERFNMVSDVDFLGIQRPECLREEDVKVLIAGFDAVDGLQWDLVWLSNVRAADVDRYMAESAGFQK